MKKLAVLFVLSIPALGLSATFSEQLERAAAQAFANHTVAVQVKLAKPIYMSDVMYRPVRGKDTVIGTDYKQTRCIGRLSAPETQVVVPLACVQDGKYHAVQIKLLFADGSQIQKSGHAVIKQQKWALIRL